MRVRMFRTERVWRRRADEYRDRLTSAHGEVARLTRELASAERRARDAENAPRPVVPDRLELVWADGFKSFVDLRHLGHR